MKKNKESEIYYFCFYVSDDLKNNLIHFPSSLPKIRYVADAIKKGNRIVNIVSSSSAQNPGYFKKREIKVDSYENNIYFSSFKTKFKIANKLSFIFELFQLMFYLFFKTGKDDKILVYHSTYYIRPLQYISKIRKIDFILEVEEIYSYVTESLYHFEKKELEFINLASSYLLVNDLISKKILDKNKPFLISYGNYNLPKKTSQKSHVDEKFINVVYAGVIEKQRQAAFKAVRMAKNLNHNYRVHILGFGSKENIRELCKLIKEINIELNEQRVIFHGEKYGDELHTFLQSCNIGISTHSYNSNTIKSSEYSFPSKLLTYMSNNLEIVTGRLEVIELSYFGKNINFYEGQSPASIAKCILGINLDTSTDFRDIVKELDRRFQLEIFELLD